MTQSVPKVLHRGDADQGRFFPMGVSVEKTPIGLGVFSHAFVPKETAIGRVRGEIIDDPDYTSDYCIDAGDDYSLEPIAPFCYLNHSCEPNCSLMQYVKDEDLDGTEVVGALSELSETVHEYVPEEECYFGGEDEAELNEFEPEYDEDAEFEDSLEDEAMLDDSKSDEAYGIEIWLESIRDIMPGEQLTIDYSWPAERAIRCSCGSPQCRGWIVDPEELRDME